MSIERKDYELEDEVDESPSPFNYKSAEEAGYGKTWGLQKWFLLRVKFLN